MIDQWWTYYFSSLAFMKPILIFSEFDFFPPSFVFSVYIFLNSECYNFRKKLLKINISAFFGTQRYVLSNGCTAGQPPNAARTHRLNGCNGGCSHVQTALLCVTRNGCRFSAHTAMKSSTKSCLASADVAALLRVSWSDELLWLCCVSLPLWGCHQHGNHRALRSAIHTG